MNEWPKIGGAAVMVRETVVGKMRRILIVDDDEVIAHLLGTLLSDAGYSSHVVASPAEADGIYDLVIADYLAPKFEPGEPWPYLETLRQLSGGAPIVGCTAHQDAVYGQPASLGVSAVVVKPFDLEQMLATVERLLGAPPSSALAN
jgi:two-component system OmpR family response regulator